MISKALDYLFCVVCKSDLSKKGNKLICKNCSNSYSIQSGIIKMLPELTTDLKFSIKKWDKFYEEQLKSGGYEKLKNKYFSIFHEDTYRQVKEAKNFNKTMVYLEIGSGDFFLGSTLAKECNLIIGIDFSYTALKISKSMLDSKGIKNYLLIQGDILSLPLKNDTIDFIYGGGVIEHFKDTQKCLNEIYRVLKNNGVSFNTVPYLNIGSLTYRQLWGNIPNFPILKELAELIHINILGGRHMIYGFEYSFPSFVLKTIHKKAGFKRVKVEKFDVAMTFDFAPSFLRNYLKKIAEGSSLFWPMVKVIAQK